MELRWTAGWFALGLLLAASACAGPQLQNGVYQEGPLHFRVGEVPAGWRPIEADPALVAFRDDAQETTIAVHGRCGKESDDVPLTALTHHLFLYFTNRRVLSQELFKLDGREALKTEMVAELDGVPKHFTVVVLKKDGCVYDFMRITSVSRAKSSTHDFESFFQGFATLS